jgi:hypothetical protein
MDEARDTEGVMIERKERLHGEGEAHPTKEGLERSGTGQGHVQ